MESFETYPGTSIVHIVMKTMIYFQIIILFRILNHQMEK
jgi:hypothetical protein